MARCDEKWRNTDGHKDARMAEIREDFGQMTAFHICDQNNRQTSIRRLLYE